MEDIQTVECTQNADLRKCAVCFGTSDVGRVCDGCLQPMHHFCSHDVAALVYDSAGNPLQDFGDECFCSVDCYNRRGGRSISMVDLLNSNIDQSTMRMCVQCGEESCFNKKCVKCDGHVHEECSRKVQVSMGASADTEVILCSEKCYQSWKPTNKQLPHHLVGKEVSFSPQEEAWMHPSLNKAYKAYADIGSTYITGRITRAIKQKRTKEQKEQKQNAKEKQNDQKSPTYLFEVIWCETALSKKALRHKLTIELVHRGLANRERLAKDRVPGENWVDMCKTDPSPNINLEVVSEEDLQIMDDEFRRFSMGPNNVSNLEEVEKIQSLNFSSHHYLEEPKDLYPSMDAKLKDEHKERFLRSASSAFFAYLPVGFWKRVVDNTNIHMEPKRMRSIELDEFMQFLGILFYMTIVDKGEYSNYWGQQVEDVMFKGQTSISLDSVMPLKRFKAIRKHLSFRAVVPVDELKKDPAARLRPLINQLKIRSPLYVVVGRNVSVDEASVACRSKFARHLVVFNPQKPTGKDFHLICTCAHMICRKISFQDICLLLCFHMVEYRI